VAWKAAIERRDGPTSLVFTRQNLPHQDRSPEQLEAVQRGGYVLLDAPGGDPKAILIATGSEVALAVEAAQALNAQGKGVRVVSMPCAEVFDQQDPVYQESVLPAGIRARVAIEAGVPDYWYRYVGIGGRVIGMRTFGASAPAAELFKHFGFTVEQVVGAVNAVLAP
jgi:transketolase